MSASHSPAAGIPTPFAGRYDLVAAIGSGASSTVYRAHDPVAGGEIALKVLDQRLSWDPEALARLRREALVSRRVTHPGVVRVHDLVTDGSFAAIVAELVEGTSLGAILAASSPLPVERALVIARGVVETLAACHQKGVYHRDVKPSNVLVEPGDRVRLIDFGLARVSLMTTVTHTGAILGTPGWQAPEVLRGERADLRADLYGVGLLLFQMLTGRHPFGEEEALRARRQLHDPPPDPAAIRPGLPPALGRLVAALLDPHPELRPSDGHEVLAGLDRHDLRAAAQAAGVECRECGQASRSPIPFCPRCGLFKRIPIKAGERFVRVRGIARAEDYQGHLARLFGAAVRPALVPRFGAGQAASVILARGVAQETAEALAADAQRFGGDAEVGRGLGWLQLGETVPDWVLATGLIGSLLAAFGAGQFALSTAFGTWLALHAPAFRLGIFALDAGLIAVLAAGASRPLLHFAGVKERKGGRPTEAAARLARRVAALREGPLAGELAGAVDAWWGARAELQEVGRRGAPDARAATSLDAALERLFDLVARASGVAAGLEGRGVAEAARDLERVQAQRRRGELAPATVERIEAAVREDLVTREQAEHLLAVAASRLVLARGVFRRLGESLAATREPEHRMAEVEELLAAADLELGALDDIRAAVGRAPDGVSGASGPLRTAPD